MEEGGRIGDGRVAKVGAREIGRDLRDVQSRILPLIPLMM